MPAGAFRRCRSLSRGSVHQLAVARPTRQHQPPPRTWDWRKADQRGRFEKRSAGPTDSQIRRPAARPRPPAAAQRAPLDDEQQGRAVRQLGAAPRGMPRAPAATDVSRCRGSQYAVQVGNSTVRAFAAAGSTPGPNVLHAAVDEGDDRSLGDATGGMSDTTPPRQRRVPHQDARMCMVNFKVIGVRDVERATVSRAKQRSRSRPLPFSRAKVVPIWHRTEGREASCVGMLSARRTPACERLAGEAP